MRRSNQVLHVYRMRATGKPRRCELENSSLQCITSDCCWCIFGDQVSDSNSSRRFLIPRMPSGKYVTLAWDSMCIFYVSLVAGRHVWSIDGNFLGIQLCFCRFVYIRWFYSQCGQHPWQQRTPSRFYSGSLSMPNINRNKIKWIAV